MKDGERFDATLLMLRSAPGVEVRKVPVQALEREFLVPLVEAIGHGTEGPSARHRHARGACGVRPRAQRPGIRCAREASGRRLLLRLLKVCLDGRRIARAAHHDPRDIRKRCSLARRERLLRAAMLRDRLRGSTGRRACTPPYGKSTCVLGGRAHTPKAQRDPVLSARDPVVFSVKL